MLSKNYKQKKFYLSTSNILMVQLTVEKREAISLLKIMDLLSYKLSINHKSTDIHEYHDLFFKDNIVYHFDQLSYQCNWLSNWADKMEKEAWY